MLESMPYTLTIAGKQDITTYSHALVSTDTGMKHAGAVLPLGPTAQAFVSLDEVLH